MRSFISQKGDLCISTDEQTEGYALMNWMEKNTAKITGMSIHLVDGGYTQLIIPSQGETAKDPIKETPKKPLTKTAGTR